MTATKLTSKRNTASASSGAAAPKRNSYTDEFKFKAVERLYSGERSATDLAVELGIGRSMLYEWADKIERQTPGKIQRPPGRPATGDELIENEKLRFELAKVRQELAILKSEIRKERG